MTIPEFIEKGTYNEGTGATATPAYPGSIVAGDLLVMMAVSDQAGGTVGNISTPAGWTFLKSQIIRNGSFTIVGEARLFYKRATGAEAGTVNVTRSGSNGGSYYFGAQIYQVSSNNIAFDGSPISYADSTGTVTWSVAQVSANARTLLAFSAQLDVQNIGTPAGYTNDASDGTQLNLNLHTLEDVDDGPLVTASNGHADGWATFHVAVFNVGARSFIVN